MSAIHQDRQGFLWVGTQGGGLSRFDAGRGVFDRNYRHRDDLFPRAVFRQAWEALERRLRAMVYKGLKAFDLRIPRDRSDLLDSLARWTLVLKKREDGDYHVVRVMADPKGMIPFHPYIEGGRGGLT